ncbi:MAG: hypothetical protein ACI9BW_002151 [Gammaproteobacteria bacterium]|jgi:hypothetical protein
MWIMAALAGALRNERRSQKQTYRIFILEHGHSYQSGQLQHFPVKKTGSFDGPVWLTIPKQPLVVMDQEKRNGAKVAACPATLPVCPITLLLMGTVIGNSVRVEAKCTGSLVFEAEKDEYYRIKLEETTNIIPVIKVIKTSNGSVVAAQTCSCESPDGKSIDSSTGQVNEGRN